MRIVSFQQAGAARTGFLAGSGVYGLGAVYSCWLDAGRSRIAALEAHMHASVIALLEAGEATWQGLRRLQDTLLEGRLPVEPTPIEAVGWLPPVQKPGKLVCVGLNYPGGQDPPPYPVLFHKTANALTGHRRPILTPRPPQPLEYEGELAVVIGKRCKSVSRADAPAVVAGYTIANDVGAPQIQARSSQWTSGKMLDTFCPLGPALVTRDEIADPHDLRIQTWLNGEPVQDGNTSQMIFDVYDLVSYISGLATLEPGDVILTGSPKTLGDRPDPRIPVGPGDTIAIQIEGLGVLENSVQSEEAPNG